MMLARSRYKFLWFTNRYFTSEPAVQAHELAFSFFRGVPEEIVRLTVKVQMKENASRFYRDAASHELNFFKEAMPNVFPGVLVAPSPFLLITWPIHSCSNTRAMLYALREVPRASRNE